MQNEPDDAVSGESLFLFLAFIYQIYYITAMLVIIFAHIIHTIMAKSTIQHIKSHYYSRLIVPPLLQAKLETKALKAKRPGFTDERYTETSYWFENGEWDSGNDTRTLIGY